MATPKFLQRLLAEGERRRQADCQKQRRKVHDEEAEEALEEDVCSASGEGRASGLSDMAPERDAQQDSACQQRKDETLPALSYSSSSTTSSEPSSADTDNLDESWPLPYNETSLRDTCSKEATDEPTTSLATRLPSQAILTDPKPLTSEIAISESHNAPLPSSSSNASSAYPYSGSYSSSSAYSSPASAFSYTSTSSYTSSCSFSSLQPLVLPPASLDLLPPSSSSSSLTPTVLLPPTSQCSTPEPNTNCAMDNVDADDSESTEGGQDPRDQLLQPPDNFAMVAADVYRSSFPKIPNFPFLRSLGLKTVLTLVGDEYPEPNRQFVESEGITFIQIGIPGNKEPFVSIPDERIRQALSIVLDTRNHPLMIHCNKGKHRTGCLVGCLRKMQAWSSTSIFEEYRKFSFPKSRAMDQLFIELFQPDWKVVDHAFLPEWCQGEEAEAAHRSRSLAQQAALEQRNLRFR